MKKTLLLSVVVSTMIFGGGDITSVEPAGVIPATIPAPAPVVASNWKFSGQGVVYYESSDISGDLFEQKSSLANAGVQMRTANDNVIGGIGTGVELTGLGTLRLEEDVVSGVMQNAGSLNSAYLSQAYLTYGLGNTTVKVGRQELPKSLSPFAYSEDWNVFKNTFDATLIVNTDIPSTTLVGAWVRELNHNGVGANMSDFSKINQNNGIWMLTAQNKSIKDLTLTGSYYYGRDYIGSNDLNIIWGDAQYNPANTIVALQGGKITSDGFTKDTNVFGVKLETNIKGINTSIAFSNVNEGTSGIFNAGGTTTSLYTNTVLDEVGEGILTDVSKTVVSANTDLLGGKINGAYAYYDYNSESFNEVDLSYTTKITDELAADVAYVYTDKNDKDTNIIRVIGRYNF